jgi:hypothetical protein
MRTKLGDMICVDAKRGDRCHICAEYPEKSGTKAVAVALDYSGYNWVICQACITKLQETADKDVVPSESSSR